MDDLYGCCKDRHAMLVETFGLPEAEIRCLLLFRHDRYQTSRGLADELNVAKSRITKLIGSLENKGLIKRIPDPEDARVTLLCLNGQGERLVQEIDEFRQAMLVDILSLVPEDSRSTLLEALSSLKRSMKIIRERHCG
jgi:DNA-binding MarR family transcriptional regulator